LVLQVHNNNVSKSKKIPSLLSECKFDSRCEEVVSEFPYIWEFMKTNFIEENDSDTI